MKKLTKKQIEYLLSKELPSFKFDYSGDDYALAYEDRCYREAVKDFNYVLPALKYYLKSRSLNTLNTHGISIKRVLAVNSFLSTIQWELVKFTESKISERRNNEKQ